ncbi:MAG: DUF4071 domain-containing protein [Chitinophagaceae bacterium]|nr:DUF4071 domain-containing protein [Chitinophagaceae bacterium]
MSAETARFANSQNEIASDASVEISAAIFNKDSQEIVELFKNGGLPWHTTPTLGCKAAESLTKLGNYQEAVEILEQLEQRFPKSIRPRQLHALALARRKANDDLKQAQKILGKLYAGGERDPETLGIYGRTWMDRYDLSGKAEDLLQSRNYYEEAFIRAADDYYTGINAAAKSILLGENDKGKQLALKVEAIVGTQAIPGDYWMTATVAEAFLIQEKYNEAGDMYSRAVAIAPTETGSHQSTWRQAKKLVDKLQPAETEKLFVLNAFKHLPGFPNS